ncbi:hypothetical protein FPOAC1_012418 [Fusarium poae]|uniref:hypothetical protein n=1 Tax=Fusarium poae TaxID=36050 RepID=UPI001CEA1AE0|nr:hypothetical protein FPOAC1_012418 [Fusarium poae]KAG8667585.1 hypothetical protein FPOAC1_012418 [Fusarium poae]
MGWMAAAAAAAAAIGTGTGTACEPRVVTAFKPDFTKFGHLFDTTTGGNDFTFWSKYPNHATVVSELYQVETSS